MVREICPFAISNQFALLCPDVVPYNLVTRKSGWQV
jgi:hypothetical protein